MNSRLASISNKQQEEITPLLLALGDTEKSDVAPTAAPAAATISLSWAFPTPYSEGLRLDVLSTPRRLSGAVLEGILGHAACTAASASFHSHCLPGFNNDKGLVLTFLYFPFSLPHL